MPTVSRSDRNLLLGAGAIILVLLTVIAVFSPREEHDIGYPSSYSGQSHGAEAAYLLLKEQGYDVARWESSPLDLPADPRGKLLVLAEPFWRGNQQEKDAIDRFLVRGGRVLGIGTRAGYLLPRNTSHGSDAFQFGMKDYDALMPSALTRGGKISMESAASWESDADELEHFGVTGHTVVVSFPVGQGEVIWWGSATPLSNAGITRPGNLALFLNSVGDKHTVVLWDEYFHQSQPGFSAYINATPLKWGGAQLGLLAAAIVFTFSRRSGPVLPLRVRSRLSPLEFVSMLGRLYARAQANSLAVDVHYQRFQHLLTRRLGISANASASVLAAKVEDLLGKQNPEFRSCLLQCESARHDQDLSRGEALRLVQQVNDIERELGLISKTEENV